MGQVPFGAIGGSRLTGCGVFSLEERIIVRFEREGEDI